MKFANQIGYSDVNPFEVVKVVSEICVEARAMKAEALHKHADLDFQPGGFFGHCANQRAQKWDIQPDLAAPVVRLRKSAAKKPGKAGYWFDKNGNRYKLADEPHKFYDFNF
jgi:hypothetical protein